MNQLVLDKTNNDPSRQHPGSNGAGIVRIAMAALLTNDMKENFSGIIAIVA
jgi:hypothetical protein